MEWEFAKTRLTGYGRLIDPKGKEYNVNFDNDGRIKVTTTKQNKPVKIPQKVYKMIMAAIQN